MLKLPFIDWIWRAKGFVELAPPRTADSAFAKLDALLEESGTSYEIDGDTLTYVKDNPAAQDKLATFPRGTLQVVEEDGQSRLKYNLTSPALLFCFLAPLLFLAFAQGSIILSDLERPTEAEKAEAEAEKAEEEEEEPKPLNVIDEWLGAPAPETLEEKKQREEEEEAEKKDKFSSTPALVFAGLFAFLFLVGRFLEPWLIRRTFRRALNDPPEELDGEPDIPTEA
ncbi:hypothetical protein [Alteraurantiacibacter aquimixticola]|uniref:Uncharacterized protein n=1 Tax=Alteraurantiacibacter aquimixticola TaxID=2489173 RepID=A0A4T3EYS8_9SPHN|nr:hypothetical protein [Alteraurantiacibacter aquimixticola]TIX49818.1 hypothetical protein E5222_13510 [Alteraurantiacibacter aquimixticola]